MGLDVSNKENWFIERLDLVYDTMGNAIGNCCAGRMTDDQKAAKKDAKFKEGLITKTSSSATSSSAVLGKYKPTHTTA